MIQLVTVASVLSQVQPAQSIKTDNDASVDQWAQRLSVSREQLLAAVAEVGDSIAAVRRHLAK
ncbi:MAG: serine hydroxymethyltransferase [Proteobacteria bacterium SG_bin9]|nr:MAG: serine hydroxymethyltransferase [Proteobacteria bacterium SG_bin9]